MEYQEVVNVFLALGGIAIFLGVLFALLGSIPMIIMLVAQAKVNQKADKPGWAAIVPYYSQYVRAEIGGNVAAFWPFFIASLVSGACSLAENSENQGVLIIAALISLVATIIALVYRVKMDHSLALAFGKDGGFTVGLVLLPFVFYSILAWGPSIYKHADKEATSPYNGREYGHAEMITNTQNEYNSYQGL